ncbi:hypothetical protein PROFUN_01505 [Planoprotostelium fungivorum]|uniref:Uncharacterized protein n=1 Tax=Planoprotostelium fungivorum TaxID=1890364 RepID=A0A2P6NTE8_9EUKA|nr:hypothetical protein PROFUN_01505 [Planoprotostelium fungivorum]
MRIPETFFQFPTPGTEVALAEDDKNRQFNVCHLSEEPTVTRISGYTTRNKITRHVKESSAQAVIEIRRIR